MGCLDHLGVVVGYHGLTLACKVRHKCTALLLLANLSPWIVSERLMHPSVTLTLDTYSHVLPTMQRAAADQLEQMLFR
ncbi:MAG: integrase family protein [Cyanobacteria bacterium RYN_339]|nr:integrase family protein [Cyanobacteria bacterium RYN_339]